MRIVLDEKLPRPLRRVFGPEHQVATVQELGLAGTSNDALLAQLEGGFDVFVTADKNLRYQQNLAGRTLAIVELPTNRLPALKGMSAELASAVPSATPGSYLQVTSPRRPPRTARPLDGRAVGCLGRELIRPPRSGGRPGRPREPSGLRAGLYSRGRGDRWGTVGSGDGGRGSAR